MVSSDSQINKPQLGRPKRAELLDVNINTGTQSINTERASLSLYAQSHCIEVHYIAFIYFSQGGSLQ